MSRIGTIGGLSLIGFLALAGCGGAMPEAGAGDFAGTYNSTWMSLAHITSPPGVADQPYTSNDVVTIAAVSGHSFIFTDASNGCSSTFDRNGDTAVTSPTGQTCTQLLNNGATQTSTADCTATINGGALLIECTGDAKGVNAGVPYTATWTGSWTGTRQ
jgi:hypothetical protein